MNVTNRAEKVDGKNGMICLVSMFPSLTSLNCPKKGIFLQFCAEFNKKSMSIKAIDIYASERSHYVLSEK